LLLAYPGYAWVSAAYNQYTLQRQLESAAGAPDVSPLDWHDSRVADLSHGKATDELFPSESLTIDNPVMFGLSSDPEERPEEFPGAMLKIPKIDLSCAVVYGVELDKLNKGPGLYPSSAWPGESGNVAIAAHRTTWGSWFRHIDKLEQGDLIYMVYEGARYKYEVEEVFVTEKNDWSVIEETEESVLTLTTCHPPGTTRRRLIVRAALVDVELLDG
jgi:sortase A